MPRVNLPPLLLPEALSESASTNTLSNPEVAIWEVPTSIFPNPELIAPLLSVPTVVSPLAVVMLFWVEVEIVPSITPPPDTTKLPVVDKLLALESHLTYLPELSPKAVKSTPLSSAPSVNEPCWSLVPDAASHTIPTELEFLL